MGFPKLLTLALLVLAVWFATRWIQRVNAIRAAMARHEAELRTAGRPGGRAVPAAEDMVKCRSCGVYVSPRGAAACGRPDCPYGRA